MHKPHCGLVYLRRINSAQHRSTSRQDTTKPGDTHSHLLTQSADRPSWESVFHGSMWHAAMLCMPTTRAQSCLFVWWRELAPARPHLPEPSGSHPAPGAGWPRVTHVRGRRRRGGGGGGGGVRRRAPKWAFFHQCYVTWQFHLLCVKDWPDWFWGGA